MHRDSLLRELTELARLASWTSRDLAHINGRWGKLATISQLTACRDRLAEMTADATDILPEEDAVDLMEGYSRLFDAYLRRYVPLATFTVLPEPVSAAGARVAHNVALFTGNKRPLEDAVNYREWAAEVARLDLMGMGRKGAA